MRDATGDTEVYGRTLPIQEMGAMTVFTVAQCV